MEVGTRVYWDDDARWCLVKEVHEDGRLVVCAEKNADMCWTVNQKRVRPASEIEGALIVTTEIFPEGIFFPGE